MSRPNPRIQSLAGNGDLDRKLFAAVGQLGRALRGARQHLATRYHLSALGVSILETLADDRKRRVGDLAADLGISQPTVSDALSTLDRRGLVVRRTDPTDRRSTLVSLSSAGAEIAADIASDLLPLLTTGPESAKARGSTLRLLLAEIARIQAAGAISVNRSCLTCRHYQVPHSSSPAHCLLLDQRLHDIDLRVDCGDHQPTTTDRSPKAPPSP